MNQLWTEFYRPKTIQDYVFRDENQRLQVATWIKEKSFPHLLLSGSPGVGKTTLAKILINEVEIEEYDVLEINASRERGIDEVRDKITTFISMIPFGSFKVVLLDEADALTPAAQAAMRGVMEEYHQTARFILTANFPNRIIPAIHSRCQGFHIEKVDPTEFTARAATILINENIEFDLDTLDTFVKITYPDLRKCINLLQQNCRNSVLHSPNTTDSGMSDWRTKMVALFKAGKFREARQLICSSAQSNEMEDIYKWLYQNLDFFGTTDEAKDNAVLIIKQGLVDHAVCADAEICMSATLIKLFRLKYRPDAGRWPLDLF
jgi:replication factor C small subunit